MKKVFVLQGLDCPHCAATIQEEVAKLSGVTYASVNLMGQTLTVEAEDAAGRNLTAQVEQIVHSHEPQVAVLEKGEPKEEKDNSDKLMLIRLAVGVPLFALGFALRGPWQLAALIAAYLIFGGDVVLAAIRNIARGRVFDENFLMSISSIGAFIIGEHPEAVAVMLFYQVGEYFQGRAVRRSRQSISELMDIRPDFARVSRGGELVIVSPETVAVGEVIVLHPGEQVPLDGVVTEGSSTLDTKALTGESLPREVGISDEVLSGCVNGGGVLSIRVTKPFEESTAAKIIDLVESAAAKKAPTENFITSFARYYTPIVVILAALLALLPPLVAGEDWADWIHRAFVFLVISCPCALVISVPLAFFAGIGAASRHGVLVKGGNFLEALQKVRCFVFDKTGTLTEGVFSVKEVVCAEYFDKEQVLFYAACAECFSNHPIGRSVLTAYDKDIDRRALANYRELPGQGISVELNGVQILAGNDTLMEKENIAYASCHAVGTKVYVAVNGQYAGCIVVSDKVKADSKDTIAALRAQGIQTVMLTGDNTTIAHAVAEEVGVSEFHAELLPHQKVACMEGLEKLSCGKLAFVGDGINDAPVLARADVGIAMGGLGSDAAIQAADIVLMTDEPKKILEAIAIAKATKRIVVQNIVLSLCVKGLFLLLGACGIIGMWEAVFGDVGVALIAVLNAMRVLKK